MIDIEKVIKEVKSLSHTLEETKLEHSRLLGERESEVKRMKSEFGIDTLEEAEVEIKKLQKKLAKIDQQIIDRYTKMKGKYDAIDAK